MAISLSTAARNQQARASTLSVGLLRTALANRSAILTNDIPGLQALLLLCQYVFYMPGVADLWLLTGISSEACIDMGLHQELPKHLKVNEDIRDLRRRVFWCAWEMEVAVSAAFLRPLRILTKHITIPFPSHLDILQVASPLLRQRNQYVCTRIWLHREIEARILSVLHQNEPLPAECSSLDQWLEQSEREIYDWLHGVEQVVACKQHSSDRSIWGEMNTYAKIGTNVLLVLLYRPSTRIKSPSQEHWMKAFVAAIGVASGYTEQVNTEYGAIKYVFHPCHHTFSAAMVFLQAFSRCMPEIATRYSLEEVEEFTLRFSRFFLTISERWHAASHCLREYNQLLETVMQDYRSFLFENVTEQLHENAYLQEPNSVYDLMDPWTKFRTAFSDSSNSLADLYLHIPFDWNAEFELGM